MRNRWEALMERREAGKEEKDELHIQ